MFIEDEARAVAHGAGAKTMTIEFPVKAGGKRTAVFEVVGWIRQDCRSGDGAGRVCEALDATLCTRSGRREAHAASRVTRHDRRSKLA
jgi:hypothetical protein